MWLCNPPTNLMEPDIIIYTCTYIIYVYIIIRYIYVYVSVGAHVCYYRAQTFLYQSNN